MGCVLILFYVIIDHMEKLLAPNFKLPDQRGQTHELRKYRGRWVVLYFYPKDNTPGCTTEAIQFKEWYKKFQDLGIVVLGISKDSVESHARFASKYDLPFPILSDTSLEILQKYNAYGVKRRFGREYDGVFRKTFIINPEGYVIKEYKTVKPAVHAEQVYNDLVTLINEQ